ncbi:hypothetical protein ACFL1G_03995 [Planctomycetota bacterium]
MLRKFAQISTLAIISLASCSSDTSPIKAAGGDRIDTPAGMIQYLDRQNLPALVSVTTWANRYGPGLKLTTRHYEIFTTLLEPLMLRQVPGFIESAYRSYNNQLPEPVESETKFKIYLFAKRKQWEDFTDEFTGCQAPVYRKIKAGAYYLKGTCVVYNIGRERTFSVLGHEGWHQFNKRHFKYRLPSWLDEGIAMLFEVSRYDQGLFYFEPSRNLYRLAALKKTIIENKMIPLEQLIALNPGEVLITDEPEDTVRAFYAQSYALVRFLREEAYGRWLASYHQLLMDGLKGQWLLSAEAKQIAADRNIPLTIRWNRTVGSQLFEYYISDDFKQIKQEYIRYCRKLVYHIRLKK